METLKGIAGKVRFSTEVEGMEDSTATRQIAVFEIDGKPVEIKLRESIMIDEGDSIRVAGKIQKGIFKAYAYKNLTNGASGKGQVLMYMFMGLVFLMMGIFTIPFMIGFLLLPVGLYMIYHSVRLSKAYGLVSKENYT